MFIYSGFRPVLKPCARRTVAPLLTIIIFASALLAWASPLRAETSAALTLDEAEQLALSAEPGQAVIRAEAEALAAEAEVSGALPNPALRIGLNNYPIQSGDFSTEGMTNAGVTLRQSFPAGRSREYGRTRLNSLASAAVRRSDARGRQVREATRATWYTVYYWQTAGALLRDARPFFEDLAAVTRSLYSVGQKSQQDVLRADLELSRLEDRLIEHRRAESAARARLAGWIGPDAMRPLPGSLPVLAPVPAVEVLVDAAESHPDLLAADATVDASRAAVMLADEKSKPGWAIDVGYSYREGMLTTGEPRPDFFTIGVTVDMPVFRKRSVDSELTAALRQRSAAESRRELLLRETTATLYFEYANWTELSRRLELFDQRILGQSAATAEAALLAYQSDTADFADVMRAYIEDLDLRLEFVRLKVERAHSHAALANLGGF